MPAVTWHTDGSVEALWPAVLRGTPHERVVVHVGSAGGQRHAAETAKSLVAFLRTQHPAGRVDVIDLARDPSPCEPRILVDAVRLRAGASVPTLWLEPFFLIRVCDATPDPRYGVTSVLAAQATLLDGTHDRDLDVIYEAHRLLAADLSIACGSVRFGERASGPWWAASASDVALEAGVAFAAGAVPERLPHLRHVARHEIVSLEPSFDGTPPALAGYLTPRWHVRLRRVLVDAGHLGRTIRADGAAAAANLYRIPDFIQRHWGGASDA